MGYAEAIVSHNLYHNLLVHLFNLWDFCLIPRETIDNCSSIVLAAGSSSTTLSSSASDPSTLAVPQETVTATPPTARCSSVSTATSSSTSPSELDANSPHGRKVKRPRASSSPSPVIRSISSGSK